MRRSILACSAALWLVSGAAAAAPELAAGAAAPAGPAPTAAAPGSPAKARSIKAHAKGATAKAAPEPPPPSPVKLWIEAPNAVGLWTMHVANEGTAPVVVVADARLLRLDVTPRGAAHARSCQLPDDMRPNDDLERPLVLAPQHEYVERFDPRLYCLLGPDLDALSPMSIVQARLGWYGKGTSPPLEVAAADGAKSEISPRKSVESAPIAIPDDLDEGQPPVHRSLEAPHLAIAGARVVDAESPNGMTIPVTLTNEGSRAIVVRFRPETVSFDVMGPGGAQQRCGWPALPTAAQRDLFTTLGPRASTTLDLELSAYCPTRAFDHEGLFVVRPRLDTRAASGAHIGVRAFDGVVLATTPTLARLHRGLAMPSPPRPLARPIADAPPEQP